MKKSSHIVRILATVLCLVATFCGVAFAEWNLPFDGYVTGEQVSVYKGSDTQSGRITRLAKNSSVTVTDIEQIGDKIWYQILFNGNKQGYIDSKYVEKQVVAMAYNSLLDLDNLRLGTDEVGILLSAGTSIDVPKNGTATVIYEGVGTYSGSFKEGKRSGEGTFVWDTGEYYVGKWTNDRIHGKGVLVFADGTTYTGSFQKGKLHTGTMEIVQATGAVLTRKIQEGTVQRAATLVCTDGASVEGRMNSKGFYGDTTIKYANGDMYVGALLEGLKSGEGTYTWVNGAHYVGAWKNDMMNGSGTYYFSSNKKNNYLRGKFTDNNPTSTITYVSERGIYYDTTWKNGKCVTITVQKKK